MGDFPTRKSREKKAKFAKRVFSFKITGNL